MNSKRILGFLAVAGLLIIAAPSERAMALSPINPGAVAAQESGKLTTWLGRLHDGRESGALTGGAFDFRAKFG